MFNMFFIMFLAWCFLCWFCIHFVFSPDHFRFSGCIVFVFVFRFTDFLLFAKFIISGLVFIHVLFFSFIQYFHVSLSSIVNHSSIYFAVILIMVMFSWDNRNVNVCRLSGMVSKFGVILFIFLKASRFWAVNFVQSIRKCISSPNIPQVGQSLPSRFIAGLHLLPFSIIRWWSDNLSFIMAFRWHVLLMR